VSEEYDLKESVSKLGRLVPIIKDAHGNIIDGFHRQKFDPKWSEEFSIKLDNITDPIQLLLARMNINTHRRTVSAEEKTQWLKELAELTKWTPKEIAEHSGMSENWVYKYLPKELKRPEPEQFAAAKVSEETIDSTRRVLEKMPETPKEPQIEQTRKGTCVHCSLDSWFIRDWEGQGVCQLCYERLQKGEITLEKPRPKPKTVEAVAPRVETKVIKPPETWEHRKASMQVPVSKMEERVLVKLEAKGIHLITQKEFCLQRTFADYYDPQQNVAFYLDGEVHRGREDRDDALRQLLTKRYGVRVVSILYEGSSEATEDKIVQEILEGVKL
jgi:very-short-patch-repair endonuclease